MHCSVNSRLHIAIYQDHSQSQYPTASLRGELSQNTALMAAFRVLFPADMNGSAHMHGLTHNSPTHYHHERSHHHLLQALFGAPSARFGIIQGRVELSVTLLSQDKVWPAPTWTDFTVFSLSLGFRNGVRLALHARIVDQHRHVAPPSTMQNHASGSYVHDRHINFPSIFGIGTFSPYLARCSRGNDKNSLQG